MFRNCMQKYEKSHQKGPHMGSKIQKGQEKNDLKSTPKVDRKLEAGALMEDAVCAPGLGDPLAQYID